MKETSIKQLEVGFRREQVTDFYINLIHSKENSFNPVFISKDFFRKHLSLLLLLFNISGNNFFAGHLAHKGVI